MFKLVNSSEIALSFLLVRSEEGDHNFMKFPDRIRTIFSDAEFWKVDDLILLLCEYGMICTSEYPILLGIGLELTEVEKFGLSLRSRNPKIREFYLKPKINLDFRHYPESGRVMATNLNFEFVSYLQYNMMLWSRKRFCLMHYHYFMLCNDHGRWPKISQRQFIKIFKNLVGLNEYEFKKIISKFKKTTYHDNPARENWLSSE